MQVCFMFARVDTPSSPVREKEKVRERDKESEKEGGREREKEGEIGRECEKERGRCSIWLLYFYF